MFDFRAPDGYLYLTLCAPGTRRFIPNVVLHQHKIAFCAPIRAPSTNAVRWTCPAHAPLIPYWFLDLSCEKGETLKRRPNYLKSCCSSCRHGTGSPYYRLLENILFKKLVSFLSHVCQCVVLLPGRVHSMQNLRQKR